jgi:molecular chaperone GrpE
MSTENNNNSIDQMDQEVNSQDYNENDVTKTEQENENLESLATALAQEKDKFLRLFAEFENYKKRTTKERIDLFKTANQEVLQALLPVLDDFDRALQEINKSSDEALVQGVHLIHDKLNNILVSKGLEEVEIAIGDAFDADFAEAITQIPAPSDDLKGKIVDVIEKGYKLGDKIIRFPKVIIGQ